MRPHGRGEFVGVRIAGDEEAVDLVGERQQARVGAEVERRSDVDHAEPAASHLELTIGEHRGGHVGGPQRGERIPAVATNIEAPMRSEYAGSRIGPLMQVVIPPVAQAEQLAAAITWLLSDDSANVNGVILPSDGGWSAI